MEANEWWIFKDGGRRSPCSRRISAPVNSAFLILFILILFWFSKSADIVGSPFHSRPFATVSLDVGRFQFCCFGPSAAPENQINSSQNLGYRFVKVCVWTPEKGLFFNFLSKIFWMHLILGPYFYFFLPWLWGWNLPVHASMTGWKWWRGKPSSSSSSCRTRSQNSKACRVSWFSPSPCKRLTFPANNEGGGGDLRPTQTRRRPAVCRMLPLLIKRETQVLTCGIIPNHGRAL